jgi:hypothetical protein
MDRNSRARAKHRQKERKEKIGGRRNNSDGPREVGCTEGGTESNKGRERERKRDKETDRRAERVIDVQKKKERE